MREGIATPARTGHFRNHHIWSNMSKAGQKLINAAHEALGLARAYGVIDRWMDPDHIRLHAGEVTAQEMRTVLAVLRAIRAEIGRP